MIDLLACCVLLASPFAAREPGGAQTPATAPQVLAIRADRLLLADGQAVAQGVLVVENGRITAAGADVAVPEGAAVVVHKGTASAGMIAMHAAFGSAAELRDTTRTVLPEAEVVRAFDPEHPDFAELAEAGITSVVLAPLPFSLCGGRSALVKTSGGTVVEPDAQLALGFSAQSLRNDRSPTSFSGALAELDQRLEKPEGPFALAAQRKLPVLFEVATREDVLRAVGFSTRHGLHGALHGAPWAGELADTIHAADLSVICGPFAIGCERRDLLAVVALGKAGVPFGFGLDAPWNAPSGLRTSAAMCVREGLDRAAAWRALTSDAARMVGAEARIGTLAAGSDADVVLWSGDPLDLSSSVVAVYVDGKPVWRKSS
jgi:hypothetical protein